MRIFLNYRRSDADVRAGRLYDALAARFGPDQIFMDVDDIPAGADFTLVLKKALDQCEVFLALIGSAWLRCNDDHGRRRLDQPGDFVRIEIESALARGDDLLVIPVLLQESDMPTAASLPPSLAPLAVRNAFSLSDRRWRVDVEDLCGELEKAPTVARVPPVDDHPAGTRKLVSVVFADRVALEDSGDETDPEALQMVLTKYYDQARAVLERHAGRMERSVGAAIVGVFGAETIHEDDALRALRAATQLIALGREFGASALGTNGSLQLGAGVATGQAIVGGDAKQSFTVGKVMNDAARLQQQAGPETVLMSARTHDLVDEEAEAVPLEVIDSAGRQQPPGVFRFERFRDEEEQDRKRRAAALVGRAREVENLERVFQDCVADNSCCLLTLLGDAGIGKSRLVLELENRLEESAARVVMGRCPSYGEGVAFFPVAQIVRAIAGLRRDENEGVVLDKLSQITSGFGLPPRAPMGLARLLGTEPPAGDVEETYWAFRSLLECVAREGPLVVVFEDLHWADEGLLELIDHVAEWSEAAPLLVVATARPEFTDKHRGWGGGRKRATTVILKPLPDDAARALLDLQLEGAELSPEARQQVLDNAAGVPLFVEEFAAFVQQGHLANASEFSTNGGALVIPTTLTALLAARLDQLPLDERTVLEKAAVIGDDVAIEPLAALSGFSEPVLTGIVSSLIRREIVGAVEGDVYRPRRVSFRHALLRETAYLSLAKAERAVLHERVVEYMDGAGTNPPAELEALVARHLEFAIEGSRQIGRVLPPPVLARAGRAFAATIADAMGRGRASDDLLARGRRIAEPDEQLRYVLGPPIASGLADNGDFEGAAQLIATWGSSGEAADVRWQLAELALRVSRLSSGDEEGAQALLERLNAAAPLEPADQIEALLGEGLLSTQCGRRADAVEVFDRAADLARINGLPHELRALRWLVTSTHFGPTPVDEVAEVVERARVRAAELGLQPAANARVNALLAAMRGDAETARRTLLEYLDLERAYGQSRQLAASGQDVFDVEWLLGDLDAARVALESSDQQLGRMKERNLRSSVLAQLARVLGRQGHAREALVAADDAEGLAEWWDSDSMLLVNSARAVAYARLGDHEEAVAAGRAATEVGTDCIYDMGEAWLSYAEAFGRAGRLDEARAAGARAIDLFEQKGVPAAIKRARANLDALESTGAWPDGG